MNEPKQEVITAAEVAHVETERRSLLAKFANRYGVETNKMLGTLKATAFRGDVTNEQMIALLIVADQHGLNPFTKEIHAFPSRGGIVPVVGVDGWARIINEHPQFDGMDFEQDDAKCTCTIHRKDRSHPTAVTEYLEECKRQTDPWTTHPKRMLRHKAMIQCARLAFSFAGIYDPDEAERVVAAEAVDVTPGEWTSGELGERKKISPKRLKALADACLAAVKAEDAVAMRAIRAGVDNEEWLYFWGKMRSYERTGISKLLDAAKSLPGVEDLAPWALEAIKVSQSLEALATTWRLIEDAFAERDQEVPADVEIVYTDRKAELGA